MALNPHQIPSLDLFFFFHAPKSFNKPFEFLLNKINRLFSVCVYCNRSQKTLQRVRYNQQRAMPPPPRKVRKHFLTRYTVKNWISNLYILLISALKMQEMPFQRPKFQKNFRGEGHDPRPPYNCVVTMASPSLKSWLRH